MRNQYFEVPFLAYYRKEYVEPELDINALWRVYHFDGKVSGVILNLCTKYCIQINDLGSFHLH